jgi:hypothetical protein
MRLTRLVSDLLTLASCRNWRLRLADFEDIMCLALGFLLVIFPVLLTLNRLATDLFVFCLGIS